MSEQPLKQKRRWKPQDILDAIRANTCVSAKVIQKTLPSLYGAAVRHFGSWKKAVEAAGFDYESVAKRKIPGYWSRERVIGGIQRLPEKNSNYVRRNQADLYNAALRLFGGWEEAVRAAGFDYNVVRKGWLKRDSE